VICHTELRIFVAGDSVMDLFIWLPVTVVLGLAAFGILFAFITGCDKV
jgi:hypothetical protein